MKKFLALTLSVMMILAALPVSAIEPGTTMSGTNILGYNYNYAANEKNVASDKNPDGTGSDFTEMPSIKAYGTGVESGDKNYGDEVDAIKYTDNTITLNAKLTDGLYFTYGEIVWASKTGTKEVSGDNPAYTVDKTKDLTTDNNTYKMVKLVENSGFDILWENEQTVARLHLWILDPNRINEYQIYVKNADGEWETSPAKIGTLNYFGDVENPNAYATFCPIVLDNTVQTKGVRFVVSDLVETKNDVYITEAVPRSTNNINLTSFNPIGAADQVTTTSTASYSIYVDKSMLGYWNNGGSVASNDNSDRLLSWYESEYKKNTTLKVDGTTTFKGFTFKWTGDNEAIENTDPVKYNNRDLFYAADFGETKIKINKVKFLIHARPQIVSAVELWCSDDDDAYSDLSDGDTDDGWRKVGEIKASDVPNGAFKSNSSEASNNKTYTHTFTAPGACEARYWKVKAVVADETETASTPIIRPVAMYSLPECEIGNEINFGYISGDSLRLTDDFRAVTPEKKSAYENLDKFWKFTKANTGIEWNFDATKDVKRLDLWVWPQYAIDTYAIQKYDSQNSTWVNVQEGDLKPDDAVLGVVGSANSKTYWNSIVLDLPEGTTLTTDKLRFVITGLADTTVGAYIAEANVESKNEINLLAKNPENNDGQAYSIYVSDAKKTLANGVASSLSDKEAYLCIPGNEYINWNNDKGMWYVASFEGSRHRINRIKLNQVNSSYVTQFEVWCSNSRADYESPETSGNGESTWQKVVTADIFCGNSHGLVFDIPNAPSAEYWMIKITGREGSTLMQGPAEFYELAESEVSDSVFVGSLGGKLSVGIALDNYDELDDDAGSTADVYLVLYRGGKILSVNCVPDVKLDSTHNIAGFRIPNGTGSSNLSLRAFIWDGSGSLKPLAGDIWMNK